MKILITGGAGFIGAAKDRLDRLNGSLHDQAHADRTRHVIDAVSLTDQLFHQLFVEYGVDDQTEVRSVFEVFNVRVAACREIVNNGDLVALSDKFVGEMASDKSGSAGDENFHKSNLTAETPRRREKDVLALLIIGESEK